MAERAPEKREVTGSTPVPTTMRRAAGVVLVCLLVVACGGDDSGDAASSPSGSSATGDDRDLGPLSELLAAVPDAGGNESFVIVNDFAGAREANDVDALDDDASDDEVTDHLLALTLRAEGVVPLVSEFAGGQTTDQAARVDEIGFDFRAVEADITAGPPPQQLQVVAGDFDPDTIEAAVENDPIWSDVLEEGEIDGVTVYSWLDEGDVEFERNSATRPTGESARLAVLSDERLAWSRGDDAIEAVIEEDDDLADRDDLGDLGAVLDDAGAVSAFLSASVVDPDDPPDGFEPYTAFGVAGGVDDDGEPILFVALWHEDEDAAEANVDALEAYAESESGDDTFPQVIPVDIEQEGHVTLGTFRVPDPDSWSRLAFLGDTLVEADTGVGPG